MFEKRLFREVSGETAYLLRMALNGLVSFLISFSVAFTMSEAVSNLFIRKQTFAKQVPWFAALGCALLLRAVSTAFFSRSFRLVAERKKNDLLLRATGGIMARGPAAGGGETSGALAMSVFESADKIELYYSEYLPQFFVLAVSLPLLLAAVFCRDAVTGLIMLVTGPLLPFFLSLVGAQSKKANGKRLESLKRLSGSMLDFLSGAKTLKIFGAAKSYREKVAQNSENFRKMTMEVLRISFLSAFVLELAATLSIAMIAVSLGLRLMAGRMAFSGAFFALLISPDYYYAIRKFGAKFHTAMAASAAVKVLFPYIDTRPAGPAGEREQPEPAGGGLEVDVSELRYTYPGAAREALSGLSLRLRVGQVTAVVGKSGSGKTTLSYLLMRFIDPDEGRILVNGEDIRAVSPDSLRRSIAYIPQKPYVFHDTLRGNLLLAKPAAEDAELLAALEKAALLPFFKNLPQGLDTVLSENGGNISSGEAQRLSFARAYLKDCPLLLMDEATSALDSHNQELIRQAFSELARGRTVLVIAHRLETVRNAGTIYVLENGRVAEAGTHRELTAAGGIYSALVSAWE